VIKVSTEDNNTDVLWTLVWSDKDWHLRVYTVDKRRTAVDDSVTWRDVTVPSNMTFKRHYTELAHDGHTSIFVTDCLKNAVHVWSSVSGQYDHQLVSPQHLLSFHRVAVDAQHHVMYVGHENGDVGVFELTYEPL
jgi:hypothetical protein